MDSPFLRKTPHATMLSTANPECTIAHDHPGEASPVAVRSANNRKAARNSRGLDAFTMAILVDS